MGILHIIPWYCYLCDLFGCFRPFDTVVLGNRLVFVFLSTRFLRRRNKKAFNKRAFIRPFYAERVLYVLSYKVARPMKIRYRRRRPRFQYLAKFYSSSRFILLDYRASAKYLQLFWSEDWREFRSKHGGHTTSSCASKRINWKKEKKENVLLRYGN